MSRLLIRLLLVCVFAATAVAQQPPPSPDTPAFKVGALLYADYTYNQSPTTVDSDGNSVHTSSFNVTRAYINIFGNLNHRISFRITPDIAREAGGGSSLTGSQDYRLKYAFGQYSLDDWTNKGSWVRLGIQQTPFMDYAESVYRYRFQGQIFEDREGIFPPSDAGLAGRWTMPRDYGEVVGGFFNGEGYNHTETNNEKAFQIRATVRPLPAAAALKGLRVTGFLDEDRYVADAPRRRAVAQVTFEHPLVNAGADYVTMTDRTSATKASVDGRGYTVWVTPKLGTTGWEALLRHDELEPNTHASAQKRKRNIAGIAYWFKTVPSVQSALMVDYDKATFPGFGRPADTRYGLKMLISF